MLQAIVCQCLTDVGDRVLRGASSAGGTTVRALPPHRVRALLDQSGFEVLTQRRIPRMGVAAWPVLTEARRL